MYESLRNKEAFTVSRLEKTKWVIAPDKSGYFLKRVCFFRCRLLLNSVHEDDSGTYTCKLSTAKGKTTNTATSETLIHVDFTPCIRFDPPLKMCVMAFAEELTSSANLRVAPSKEPLFTRKLDILEVIEGRTARFDCKVSGSPAPRVAWMHFGKNLGWALAGGDERLARRCGVRFVSR